jgi:S-adenosylmethionine synthetase
MGRRVAVDILEKRPEVQEVMVQLAYAIGYDQPLQATAIVDGEHEFIKGYDLSPKGIIEFLKLTEPIFASTAGFGHMGAGFNWK